MARNMYHSTNPLWFLVSLFLTLPLSGVRADDCWHAAGGSMHCHHAVSQVAWVSVAVAVLAVGILLIGCLAVCYRRRLRRRNLAVASGPRLIKVQTVNYGRGSYPLGYNAEAGYYPDGPQYPSNQQYGGYVPPESTSPQNVSLPTHYAPPQGPPPAVVKSEV